MAPALLCSRGTEKGYPLQDIQPIVARLCGVVALLAVQPGAAIAATPPFACEYEPRVQIGSFDANSAPNLNEASGLAQSRRNPNVFWSHQDNGACTKDRYFVLPSSALLISLDVIRSDFAAGFAPRQRVAGHEGLRMFPIDGTRQSRTLASVGLVSGHCGYHSSPDGNRRRCGEAASTC